MSQHRSPRTPATGATRSTRALSSVVLGALLVLPLAACSGDEDAAPAASSPASTAADADASATPTDGAASSDAAEDAAAPEASASSASSSGTVPGGAVGTVVEGFPADVVPLYPGAEVLSTVATADGAQRDVSLNGRTTDAPEAVVEFYRQSLVAAGFVESAAPAAEGVLSATFSRSSGAEVLQVAVISSGGGQQFTVGGTINA